MDKLKMHSPNLIEGNIAKLAALFPGCVTESHDEKGELKRSIDFDQLRQELSSAIVEGPRERYHLNWPGKREALFTANAPITKTLRPCREESVDFDTTQNLFIEGDNLDALKLLQETYLSKVKMIYIDPPYNTGNDFIFRDNFTADKEKYDIKSGLRDEASNKLIDEEKYKQNLRYNGRFHSDWLSMMYPRLKLARNLLKDDGAIFISIDDNEAHSLKRVCDEIFGEDNFISSLVWNSEGHTDNQYDIKVNHEYILVYAKDSKSIELGYVVDPNTRGDSNLWKGYAENSITKNGPGNPPSEVTLPVGFPATIDELSLKENKPVQAYFDQLKTTGYITRQMTQKFNVTYPIILNAMEIKHSKIVTECTVFSGWANVNKLKQFIANKCAPIIEANGDEIQFYLSGNGVIYYKKHRTKARNILSVLRNMGTTEQMRSEIERMGLNFSYPKPNLLLKYLVNIGFVENNGILLDFFAGSATTAHAVIGLNAEDGGNRKFIMIQLSEKCDEKSEAYKAGYSTIAEIGKERIRRAGKKIKENHESIDTNKRKEKAPGLFDENNSCELVSISGSKNLDIGFRVLKIDSSNMADVYYIPDAVEQKSLFLSTDNIKPDRTAEDLLFQVLLDWGVDMSLPVTREIIAGKEVFFVDGNALATCFVKDGGITEAFVKELAKREPLRVVFRDAGFKDDSVKINVEQIFKLMSSHTDVKTI